MTLATKAELRDEVGAWTNRATDPKFLARFDSFLALCEADFGTKLKSKANERRLQATLNERWEKNPAGGQAVKSIAILRGDAYQSRGPLDALSYQDAIKLYGATSSGEVRAYTKVGDQIGFFPFPTEDLTSTLQFEIIAYVRPDPLVAEDSDNEILLIHPGIYLYGILSQEAVWEGRDEDLAKYRGFYEQAIADANMEQAGSHSDILLVRAS